MQKRKCHICGKNKIEQQQQNIHRTKRKRNQKKIAVHRPTIKIDPNKKKNLKYKNSTELFKKNHKLKEKTKNMKFFEK